MENIKDNYARNIFILMITAVILFAFWLGVISGIIIYSVNEKFDEIHRENLIRYYNVNFEEI